MLSRERLRILWSWSEKWLCLIWIAGMLYLAAGSLKNNFYFLFNDTIFPNSDFEKGTLENWTAQGDAFRFQPVFGDRSRARGKGWANFRGNYWIGTGETDRTHLIPPPGWRATDATGDLVSMPFTIRRDRIAFLLSGGSHSDKTGVMLEIEGMPAVFAIAGYRSPTDCRMFRIVWNVSRWKGKTARLIIRDHATSQDGPWGYVNADDFRYVP
ncbi:MAG TPA: hypothetical protein VL404_00510 [Candidatus Eisenbacteria bacterium]|nr:hypothetical protein [Candidatus Eisenbacteria bacterium]